jgi:predicted Zn-dependent peptidase
MKKHNKLNELKSNYLPVSNQWKLSKYILNNGLTVITEDIPGVESLAVGITVNAGSRDDFKGKEGLAHFMEHLAFRHTKTKSSRQIAEGFESVGAYANAFTTQEHTCFYVRTLTKHFSKTFNLLTDITLNPIFREKDIEKERDIIIEEIKSNYDDPEEYIFDLADSVLFDNHPLGNPIQGYEDSVNDILSNDLIEFHKKFYSPSNILITVVGNINNHKVLSAAKKLFSDLPASNQKFLRNIPENTNAENLTEKMKISQAHLLLGKRISDYNSHERYPLMLLNTLLGDGMSSRLYQKLREKKGLAYNVYSTINYFSDSGTIYIYIATDKSNVKKSTDLIMRELTKLSEKISSANLKKAKEQLKSALIMEMENLTTRMIAIIKDELLTGKSESMAEMIHKIDNVTLEETQLIAKHYFSPAGWKEIKLIPEMKIL